jgi:uncharacterized protein (DUF4415 family)
MATVRIRASEDAQLSEQALSRLAALKDRPVDTSDIPESSPLELREIARQIREKRKKRMFTLRLETAAIEWWKSLGEGYTGIMSRLLEEAWRHPDWIKQCLESGRG